MTSVAVPHHWVDGVGDLVVPDPSKYFGFIYEIRQLSTGMRYFGKKQYHFAAGKKGQRVKDKLHPKWKDWLWKPSDWPYYKSSSKHILKAMKDTPEDDWEFEILSQHTNSRDLHYAEVDALVKADALKLVDDDGEYIYYNRSIPAVGFRPPSTLTEATRALLSDIRSGVPKSVEHRDKISKALLATNPMPEVTATCRKEAQQIGDKYYRTGKSCKRGHYSPRFTDNATCVDCHRIRDKESKRQ